MNLGERSAVYSRILDEERNIILIEPEDYDQSWEYPVINLLDTEYSRFFNNDVATLQYLLALERVPKSIMVGVINTIRNRDTLPLRISQRANSGGADNFLDFLTNELQPLIDKEYPTVFPTTLYGASNARIFTLYSLLKNPESFVDYIAISPMIGWCPDLVHLMMENFLKNPPKQKKFLYMNYGKTDLPQVTEYFRDFEQILHKNKSEQFSWETKYLPDEGHVPFTSTFDGIQAAYRHLVTGDI